MIPEEDHENFSEDEISIDVPSGSQVSVESLQTLKNGSKFASSASLDTYRNEKDMEDLTDDDDDDDDDDDNEEEEEDDDIVDNDNDVDDVFSDSDDSESSAHDDEIANCEQVKNENNEDISVRTDNAAIKDVYDKSSSTVKSKRSVKDFKDGLTVEIQNEKGEKDNTSNKHNQTSNKTDVRIKQNLKKQIKLKTAEETDARDKESVESESDDDDDNVDDVGDDSLKSEDNLTVFSDKNKGDDSADNISRDTFADDHWEEITNDENSEQKIVQYFGDSKTEITIEVSKAAEKETSPCNNGDIYESVLKRKAHLNGDSEIRCSDESSDDVSLKSLKSFKMTDKSDDFITTSKSTPCILITEGDIEARTETNNSFGKDDNVNNKSTCRQDIDRSISVSNVVLDHQSVPLTPTVEYASISYNNSEAENLRENAQSSDISEMAISCENTTHSASPTDDISRIEESGNAGDFSEFRVLTDHSETSDGRSLSPLSDIDYEYYNKRRGSQVKIKLEGRRRQRLSVSECESKHSDDDCNDVITLPVPTQVPLLDKRDKMEKISFKDLPEKQEYDHVVHETNMNSIIDISESNRFKSRENSAKSSHTTDTVKSPPKTNQKPIKNINSLNAELIAIYNYSVPEQSHHSGHQKHHKHNNSHDEHYHNKKIFPEGSHLSESRDQACETNSFVTDINQRAIKTGEQFETVTGSPRQDFNSDSTFNKFNKPREDDSRKNGETKSRLLPSNSETGNCQIKMSEKCAMERDMLSHKCEHRQLSLRQNGNKNSEIIELAYSIEQPLASQNKIYQTKGLKKTHTYGDLYKRECLSAPTVRVFSKQHKGETEKSRETNEKIQRLIIPTDKELHLNASKLTLNDRSAKVKFKTKSSEYQHEICVKKGNLEKDLTGSEDFDMSARLRRPRDDQFEMAGFADREMSARLRRSQSSLTDTARLRSIRKLLKLADDNEEKLEVKDHLRDEETRSIIQEIIEGIIHGVCSQRTRKFQTVMKSHRCVTTDDDGEEVLGCLLQTSCSDVDPSAFTCNVIDPVDLCPLTKKHEHLISNIIRISPTSGRKFNPGDELIASIPIAHWYVEKWEELVIRQQDGNGYWENVNTDTSDVIKIDDVKQVYYGVRHVLTEPCTLAVVSRPRVTSAVMTGHTLLVNSVVDDRVKMHVFPVSHEKTVNMQVVPFDQTSLSEFSEKEENKKACVIIASSPLIQIFIEGHDPESLAFDVPYVSVSARRPEVKPTVNRSSSPYLRAPDNGSRQSLLSPYLSPTQSPRRVSLASPFVKALNQRAFHLAQIDDDDEVRVKLLGNNDNKSIDVVTGQLEENNDDDEQSLRFSVYDRTARLIALETKGSLEYSDVEKVTRSFVNFIVKHKVTVSISQDPRNVYSILFSAMVDHPHRQCSPTANQAYKYFTTSYRKEVQIYEGEVVAISFRGNVDVPDREKMIYSFHGYRGIKKHFDIQVSNPMSQRSLQTYHGALQIFTFKSPRYSGLNRKLAPCNKNGWELTAEFPLLLPKYLKSTPVIVNKAPVSLRFHEPLTVDFIRTICSELVNEWTKFAKALGISHARVQAIKQQHRNQVSDKVLMDVIINWMKTQRISQDKVSPLINALRICNRQKLASELSHRFSAQKANRSKTTREKSLQRAFAVICKSSSVIAKWRQLLHHLCQDDDNHVIDVTKEIDDKYPDETTKCQHALLHWKSTTAAPSVWKLVDALRANRCTIVADTIVTSESKRK